MPSFTDGDESVPTIHASWERDVVNEFPRQMGGLRPRQRNGSLESIRPAQPVGVEP